MNRQLVLSITTLAVSWAIFADASAQTPGVIMSYSLQSPSVTLAEPAFLNVKLRNDSNSEARIDLGTNRKQNFVFNVTFPDGTTVRDLSLPLRDGVAQIGRIQVPSRQQYADTLLLNEWFTISQTGIYQVAVALSAQIEGDAGALSAVPSFQFVLNVLPRDETRLRSVCERLAEQIRDSQSVGEARKAALALSFVDDSVAVPFLADALASGKKVEAEAITGLERIGDVSAVQALAAAIPTTPGAPDLYTVSGRRALLIRSALQNLKSRSTDPAVQKLIQEALGLFRG